MASDFSLEGKVALITGASRGIGEAIAHRFARAGAMVVCTSRKVEGCEAVAEAIRSNGGRAEARACHIGDVDAIETTVAAVIEDHGRIDILVNNAATNPYFGSVFDTELRAYQKTMDVNVRGTFMMSVTVGRHMRDAKGGVILNIASIDGERPGQGRGVYSVTKAAILQMTRSFALEGAAHNIRVNAILPGLTRTRLASVLTSNPEVEALALKHIPLGRIADPVDLTGAALYLCSPAASYTTGTCMPVDGGYLLM